MSKDYDGRQYVGIDLHRRQGDAQSRFPSSGVVLRDLGDPVLVSGCCGRRSPAVPGFR